MEAIKTIGIEIPISVRSDSVTIIYGGSVMPVCACFVCGTIISEAVYILHRAAKCKEKAT